MVLFSQKVYVGEIADTKDVVDQYEKFFEHKPPLTCVGAQSLPLGAKVMIGCTALAWDETGLVVYENSSKTARGNETQVSRSDMLC
jgi:hypothetical protein